MVASVFAPEAEERVVGVPDGLLLGGAECEPRIAMGMIGWY